MMQALKTETIQFLVGLLETGLEAVDNMAATKAQIVKALKAMQLSVKYGDQVIQYNRTTFLVRSLQEKSSQRPYTSAKENMVWIRSALLDRDSGSGLLPEFNRDFLVQGYMCDKILHENPITVSGDISKLLKNPYLTVLKSPFKNSWTWIRMRRWMTSKI